MLVIENSWHLFSNDAPGHTHAHSCPYMPYFQHQYGFMVGSVSSNGNSRLNLKVTRRGHVHVCVCVACDVFARSRYACLTVYDVLLTTSAVISLET